MKKFYSKIVLEKQPVKPYPKLMIGSNGDNIYLMQSDEVGTLVNSRDDSEAIGEQYSCLDMDCLSDYSGTIQLGEQ